MHEAREELGLEVALGPLVAVAEHDGDQQFHFLARVIGGSFGSGDGPEIGSSADSEEGSHTALSADLVLADSQVLHIKD